MCVLQGNRVNIQASARSDGLKKGFQHGATVWCVKRFVEARQANLGACVRSHPA
jgi:hypothetical protein